jgi:multidrug efflux pump subunit AcrA (membrane-fusion protein)
MPGMNEITEGHSKRISRITQIRDTRLRDAVDQRDRDLRALPAAAHLYEAFDAQVGDARDKQMTTDAKAEAARAAALQENSDQLADALADAHQVRRDADVAAFEKRRKAEEDAEHEFILAIGASPSAPTSNEAQKVRAGKLEKAKKEFDAALAANQEQFRKARDAALVAESRRSRDADRAFTATARVSESSSKVARATAEQALAKALAAIPAAAAEFAEWRQETALIVADFKRAENEEFERFHNEVQALKA